MYPRHLSAACLPYTTLTKYPNTIQSSSPCKAKKQRDRDEGRDMQEEFLRVSRDLVLLSTAQLWPISTFTHKKIS